MNSGAMNNRVRIYAVEGKVYCIPFHKISQWFDCTKNTYSCKISITYMYYSLYLYKKTFGNYRSQTSRRLAVGFTSWLGCLKRILSCLVFDETLRYLRAGSSGGWPAVSFRMLSYNYKGRNRNSPISDAVPERKIAAAVHARRRLSFLGRAFIEIVRLEYPRLAVSG